jgi:cell division protein FtsI (penicillin-binding protein 3)
MKKMLEDVVLLGTGKKAILDGYTSAGKTGTAQKINPLTHRYGSKDIASFSGFAPVNNPAITVTVIIDSPVGPHHGGDVAAPVFGRVAQQALEYLDVPHDADVRNPQRMLLRASAKPGDLMEGSPDHVGDDVAAMDEAETGTQPSPEPPKREGVVTASYVQDGSVETAHGSSLPASAGGSGSQAPAVFPTSGTVVLDVDTKTVPSFIGKPVREVIEESQRDGVEVDVFGSGIARQQTPPPGSRIAPGGHVNVQFAR